MKKLLVGLLLIGTLFAASNNMISFQGKLLDNAGAAVNTPTNMTYTLYTASTGGSVVGSAISKTNVSVTNGIYSVELDVTGVSVPDDVWVQVNVAGQDLSPRIHLTSSAFALKAVTANNVIGGVVSANIVSANNFFMGNAPIVASGGSDTAGQTSACGRWVQYADGTMIEWGKTTPLTPSIISASNNNPIFTFYETFNTPKTMPKPFIDTNYIIVLNANLAGTSGAGAIWTSAIVSSTDVFYLSTGSPYSYIPTVHWHAIGRWK
jgi:hypothetical protein